MFCTIMKPKLWMLFIAFCFGHIAVSDADPVAPVYVPSAPRAEALTAPEDIDGEVALPTVTVRGFLNFRTTVDGTVIVFTPASETPQDPTPASSAPPTASSSPARLPTTTSEDAVAQDNIQHLSFTKQPDAEKREKNQADLENEANTGDDRRQPFRHLKPGFGSSNDLQSPSGSPREDVKTHGPTPALPQYPTGLVTVLGGTHVEGGATTVFETKVIGTYIEGKYAQILQSTSQIIFSAPASVTPRPTPKASPTAPTFTTPTVSVTSSKQSTSTSAFTTGRFRPSTGATVKELKPTVPSRRADRRRDDPFNANAVLQSSFKLPDGTPERPTRPTQSLGKSYTPPSFTLSRRFRPSKTTDVPEDENTVPESQNNRRLPPRFRYVLPRRNTPTVRLNRFKVKLTMRNEGGSTPQDTGFDNEDDLIEDYDSLAPVDPAQLVYEKTTITSEVTLHVGRRKSVRTLTITTSVPKTRHVASFGSNAINDAYDNNALYATSLPEGDIPPHIVVTRTYTTTERMLKTSLVPILEGNDTSYHTVTESFFILKLITGYKTLPPGEVTLLTNDSDNDFISTAALDTGLLEGAVQLDPSPHQKILQTAVPNGLLQAGSIREQAVVPLDHSGSLPLDMSNPLISLGVALQRNPLAAVYLGLQQLNRQVTQYTTVTKTSIYVATDTIYSTKVVSIYDGRRTRTRTLSESLSTTEKTMTTFTTTVEPYLNTQLFQQQHQLQQLIGNQLTGGTAPQLPLIPPPQQFSTVTSTYTTVTTATSLSTRIYTLIYNAISTKFRTVTSTTLYETTITTTTTSEVPIAITAPPGGVFPFLG